MKTTLLCLVATTLVPVAALAAPQRLYVFDIGSGKNGDATYVEYSVPTLKTAEYTGYYSFSTPFDVSKQIMYFANQGDMYALDRSSGAATPTLLFGAPHAGYVRLDSKAHIYAIDQNTNSLDEYSSAPVQGGGAKKPFRVINLSPNQANFSVVDHQDNVWISLNNNTVAVYGPTGGTPIATYNPGGAALDIKVDAAGTVWVLTGGIEPYPFTNCTPDPNGPIKRTPLIYSYVKLKLASTLYSHESDTNGIGHLAVAANGRVYYSAQNEILDYDPGTFCPNDALVVSNLSTYASAPLTLDAKGNLYAADQANASIYAYPPGSTTPFSTIQQSISGQGVQLEVH